MKLKTITTGKDITYLGIAASIVDIKGKEVSIALHTSFNACGSVLMPMEKVKRMVKEGNIIINNS